MRTLSPGRQVYTIESRLLTYLKNDWREFETISPVFNDNCIDIKHIWNIKSRIEMVKYGRIQVYMKALSIVMINQNS